MDPGSIEVKLRRAKRRLALRRFLLGRHHRATGDAYYQAGTLLREAGDVECAARWLGMAERIHRKRLGPGHPAVAMDLLAIGEYQAQWGERRRALQSLERAERILEANLVRAAGGRVWEDDGESIGMALGRVNCRMGGVVRELEMLGRARRCYERGLRLFVQEAGAASPEACEAAACLLAVGVDPLVVAREQGGESAATELTEAFRAARGVEPVPEPMI